MNENVKRLRGLLALVGSAVENGATAVERVHKATAQKSFDVLEKAPGVVAEGAAAVGEVQSAVTAGVYNSIRLITKSVVRTLDSVLESVDESDSKVTELPKTDSTK
jgi:hypothetical protein